MEGLWGGHRKHRHQWSQAAESPSQNLSRWKHRNPLRRQGNEIRSAQTNGKYISRISSTIHLHPNQPHTSSTATMTLYCRRDCPRHQCQENNKAFGKDHMTAAMHNYAAGKANSGVLCAFRCAPRMSLCPHCAAQRFVGLDRPTARTWLH